MERISRYEVKVPQDFVPIFINNYTFVWEGLRCTLSLRNDNQGHGWRYADFQVSVPDWADPDSSLAACDDARRVCAWLAWQHHRERERELAENREAWARMYPPA